MFGWIKAVVSDDSEWCSMRSRPALETTPIERAPRQLLVKTSSSRIDDLDAPNLPSRLPADFFERLADLSVNDPAIAVRILDDRTSPIIWGEAKSPSFLFLQMCIRDRHQECTELWPQLSRSEQRDLYAAYHFGPPSRDFFFNIMVNDAHMSREQSESGTSEQGDADYRANLVFS